MIYENKENIKIITLLLELKELYYNLHDTFEKHRAFCKGKCDAQELIDLDKVTVRFTCDHAPNLQSVSPQILWPFPRKIELIIPKRKHLLNFFLRFNVLFSLSYFLCRISIKPCFTHGGICCCCLFYFFTTPHIRKHILN